MSSAAAPRPCTITIAAVARSNGSPAVNSGCPSCGPVILLILSSYRPLALPDTQGLPLRRGNRAQLLFNRGTALFQPERELQISAKIANRLIDSKARASGCQFHNVSIGIIHVDALKVHSIQNRCDAQASLQQFLTPGKLCLFVGNGKGIMMRLTCPHAHAGTLLWIATKVGNQRTWTPIPHSPIPVCRLGVIKIGGHFNAPHTKQFSKERVCTLNVAANSCNVVQSLAQRH